MDKESLKKEASLLKVREESARWLDKELMADAFISFHTEWADRMRRTIESDSFKDDHNGYLLALGELKAHRRALDVITTASDRVGRATKELEQLKDANA